MKYLSLFSGIGGFELGIGDKGECVGYSEKDKYAIQVYSRHFDHRNYGDITKINEKALPDFDLIVGGFPCQAFSIAGKRHGFQDTRGTLFFDIARIAREKQPRLLLLENVKGLLSHDEGRTFLTILCTLDELGYDCQWQVLNSKDFGVPQNRERVFIIGHLRGTRRPEVFPIG
jgi:DNA (cytosine-5)-methyltransferase 1